MCKVPGDWQLQLHYYYKIMCELLLYMSLHISQMRRRLDYWTIASNGSLNFARESHQSAGFRNTGVFLGGGLL